MAAGKLVGFQVCPHLNDSNTQVFITLKDDNQNARWHHVNAFSV